MNAYEEFSTPAKSGPLLKVTAALLVVSCFLSFISLIVVCVLIQKVQDGASATADIQTAIQDFECPTVSESLPQDDILTDIQDVKNMIQDARETIREQGSKLDTIAVSLEEVDEFFNGTTKAIQNQGNVIGIILTEIRAAINMLRGNETSEDQENEVNTLLEEIQDELESIFD